MWIDNETGAVARLHDDIRNLRPYMSLPAILTDEMIESIGFSPVTIQQPSYDPLMQKAVLADPQQVDGKWVCEWSIVPLYESEEELAAAIALAKVKKNEEINAARLAANLNYFVYQEKRIACDALSRSDIDATNGYISLFGAFHQNWPGMWKAIDNSFVAITTLDEWRAFYKAMVDQGQVNFAHAQQLKTQLASATTLNEIAGIIW